VSHVVKIERTGHPGRWFQEVCLKAPLAQGTSVSSYQKPAKTAGPPRGAGHPDGAYVNLGIGQPTLVANHIPDRARGHPAKRKRHPGHGPGAGAAGKEDYDLINAGKQPVTLLPGGAYFHHADSFAMMRGGHLDICVLGAFQVSATGDLANWSTGEPGAIPAVGGAMDLATGAKQTWVMMDLLTKQGASKVVRKCTYPLTAWLRQAHLHRPVHAGLHATGLQLIDRGARPDGARAGATGGPAHPPRSLTEPLSR
jgi:3-oxoadipate CoA-transferase beta subunit